MNKNQLIKLITTDPEFIKQVKEIVKPKKKTPTYSKIAREVMAIFYRRNKALNYKRKDYWEASEALIKAYGLEAIRSKMEQLDKMVEYKPIIADPAQLRTKWFSIKEQPKAKKITTI